MTRTRSTKRIGKNGLNFPSKIDGIVPSGLQVIKNTRQFAEFLRVAFFIVAFVVAIWLKKVLVEYCFFGLVK